MKTSRIVPCIFKTGINDTRYTRTFNWTRTNMQKLTMIVYIDTSLPYKIAVTVGAFFYNFIDGRFRFYTYLYMWRKFIVNTYVSKSFVCLKFYIGADLTDLRKNSNNPYRFSWHNRDYIERFSTDCCAIVGGAMFDKQLNEHYIRKNRTIVVSSKLE